MTCRTALFRNLAAGLLALLLLGAPGPTTRAADPLPYNVSLATTGNTAIDQALHDASVLISLNTTAPVGPFALVTRAREDAARFGDVLHSFGYYDGRIDLTIDGRALDDPGLTDALEAAPATPPAQVAVGFTLGPLFHLGTVSITGSLPLGFPANLGIRTGDPARAADVLAAGDHLLAALREAGYALATVAPPAATLHPAEQTLDVAYAVNAGPRVNLGPITISGLKTVHEAYVRNRLTLHQGDRYDPDKIEANRADLAGLGVFSEVRTETASQARCRRRTAAGFRGDRAQAALRHLRPVLLDRPRRDAVGDVAGSQPVRQRRAAQPDRQRLGGRQCRHRPQLSGRRDVHQTGFPGRAISRCRSQIQALRQDLQAYDQDALLESVYDHPAALAPIDPASDRQRRAVGRAGVHPAGGCRPQLQPGRRAPDLEIRQQQQPAGADQGGPRGTGGDAHGIVVRQQRDLRDHADLGRRPIWT